MNWGALGGVDRLLAVLLLITAVEMLAARSQLARFDALDGRGAVQDRARPLGMIGAAAALVVLPDPRQAWPALLLGAACVAAQVMRFRCGDGADGMALIVCALAAVAGLLPVADAGRRWWVATTIAVVGLAYLHSGLAKVRQPAWRAGVGLSAILSTASVGSPTVLGIIDRHQRLRQLGSWSVFGIEIAYLPAVVIGGPALLVATSILAIMHVGIALTMGLGRFAWAFGSALLLVLAARGAW